MKKSIIKLVTIICLGFFIVPALLAKEVKMYTEGNVPSAEEMANILLDSTPETYNANEKKTRSITFGSAEKYKPVSIALPILFDYNSSALKTSSLTYLKQLGLMLNLEKMTNTNIMLVGHTDSTGYESYNLELSKRRSQAVKEFLVSNYQIDPTRIETTGKGESDTLQGKPGDSPVNRRVEFYRIQ